MTTSNPLNLLELSFSIMERNIIVHYESTRMLRFFNPNDLEENTIRVHLVCAVDELIKTSTEDKDIGNVLGGWILVQYAYIWKELIDSLDSRNFITTREKRLVYAKLDLIRSHSNAMILFLDKEMNDIKSEEPLNGF